MLCVCFVFLRLVYPKLPVYLVCPFLLAPLVFSNVYLHAKFNEANIIYIFFTQVFDDRTLYGIPQCPSCLITIKIPEAQHVNKHVNKTLVWPHDVESFQGSKFCLFVMVQPWNIGVCCIDQVFVTELTVVIFFVHAAVLCIKTAFNLVKIHLLFRIIPLIQ